MRQNKIDAFPCCKTHSFLGHIDIGGQIGKDDKEVKSAVSPPPFLSSSYRFAVTRNSWDEESASTFWERSVPKSAESDGYSISFSKCRKVNNLVLHCLRSSVHSPAILAMTAAPPRALRHRPLLVCDFSHPSGGKPVKQVRTSHR